MNSRFAMSSHEEIRIKEELGVSSHDINANTKKSTQTWFNVYKAWAVWRGKKTALEDYTPTELNEVLSTFYCEVRKSDGRDYEPDCLRVMQSSLYRYLTEKKYPKSIVSDGEFKSSQDVLEGKIRRLRMEGKGKKPNTVKVLTQEVEERLWQTNKLGHHSPMTLIHTMWFNNTKYFGLRGRENHVAITMENFKRKMDENGVRYIELSELPTTMGQHVLHYHNRVTSAKMIATGGRRCPVALFEFYVSKRPSEMRNAGRFYLSPRHNIGDSDGDWFRQCPMGKNTLSRMLKNILDTESRKQEVEDVNQEQIPISAPHNIHNPLSTNNVHGPLIERLQVGEDGEYAIIKIPRYLNTNMHSDYDSDDGPQIPTMANAFTAASPIPTMSNVFTISSPAPPRTNTFTNVSEGTPVQHPNNNTRSSVSPDRDRESDRRRDRENVFTHVDEKGSINVFYNCNVTIVQPEPTSKRKRKLYDNDVSSPEQ